MCLRLGLLPQAHVFWFADSKRFFSVISLSCEGIRGWPPNKIFLRFQALEGMRQP